MSGVDTPSEPVREYRLWELATTDGAKRRAEAITTLLPLIKAALQKLATDLDDCFVLSQLDGRALRSVSLQFGKRPSRTGDPERFEVVHGACLQFAESSAYEFVCLVYPFSTSANCPHEERHLVDPLTFELEAQLDRMVGAFLSVCRRSHPLAPMVSTGASLPQADQEADAVASRAWSDPTLQPLPDLYVLQPPAESPTRASEYWNVWAGSRDLASARMIASKDETEFLQWVVGAFPGDLELARVDDDMRTASNVVVDSRTRDLLHHRRFGLWRSGLIGMSTKLSPASRQPGTFSLPAFCLDLMGFLQLLVSHTHLSPPRTLRLSLMAGELRPRIQAERRGILGERSVFNLQGIDESTLAAEPQNHPLDGSFSLQGSLSIPEVPEAVAQVLAYLLRTVYRARVDEDRLAASIASLRSL